MTLLLVGNACYHQLSEPGRRDRLDNLAFLAPEFGVHQGFQTFWLGNPQLDSLRFTPSEHLAKVLDPENYFQIEWPYYRDTYITRNAIQWLKATQGRQFFLFLNYMDVHTPTWRPPSGNAAFGNDSPPHSQKPRKDLLLELQQKPLSPIVKQSLIDNYDRELIHLDQEVSRLLDYLAFSGIDQKSVVILTSDHGEYFGEHGLIGHSMHLHGEVVNETAYY